MAIRWKADTSVKIRTVLACDESVQAANTPEDIEALLKDGTQPPNIPEDATVVEFYPLSQAQIVAALQAAGEPPRGVMVAPGLVDDTDSGDEDEDDAEEVGPPIDRAAVAAWWHRFAIEKAVRSVERISDSKGYVAEGVGDDRIYPHYPILKLADEALLELHQHIERATSVGKAPCLP